MDHQAFLLLPDFADNGPKKKKFLSMHALTVCGNCAYENVRLISLLKSEWTPSGHGTRAFKHLYSRRTTGTLSPLFMR